MNRLLVIGTLNPTMKSLGFLALAARCALALPSAPSHDADVYRTRRDSIVDRVIPDLCGKRVVLLGESPTHGFGKTLQMKVEIARRLVDECHFNAFVIESGVYDFLKIQKTLSAGGLVEQSDVAAAIGGLWANREVEPLIPFLVEKARRGTLSLGGLDDQLGRGTYAQQRMAFDLTQALPAADRPRCLGILQRHLQWQYSDAAPYSANDKTLLLACLGAIRRSIPAAGARGEYELPMIQNLERNIGRDFSEDPAAGIDRDTQKFNARDRSMFMNFEWFMSRLPARTKVIVWTATTHAAKTLSGVPGDDHRVSLGSYIHRRFTGDAFALGFSAYEGTYAMARQTPRPLVAAPPNSLEGRAFAHGDVEPRYLDRRALQALGGIPGRPLGVDFKVANWSEVLDGLVVFREEHPPTR
jgi:erythromycin esterase-like protein